MLRALYVDFNSYFASVEQLLRPELRGQPVAVLPVVADTTCCIAASYEAKAFGIRTGTSVKEARRLCPGLRFVEARPALYVEYHHRLVELVESCLHVERTLSIDEMVCPLTGSHQRPEKAHTLAIQIKQRIATTIGKEIRCSIGIAPNTFLAKVASNMQKPDGCVVIQQHELPDRLYGLELRDLNGIGKGVLQRLNRHGIFTIPQLYACSAQQLRLAWGSIEGARMHAMLRGLELHNAPSRRNSLGHSHVLPPELRTHHAAYSVLHRLLQKAASRLRSYALEAGALRIHVKFRNREDWVAEGQIPSTTDTLVMLHALDQLWQGYPARRGAPYAVGVTLYRLCDPAENIRSLFQEHGQAPQNAALAHAIDRLNQRYGKNTIYFGGAHAALHAAPMRIAFNHIPDLVVETDQ